jgi:hypothetical protein
MVEDELGDGERADDERDRRDEPGRVPAHPGPCREDVVGHVLDLEQRLRHARARAGAALFELVHSLDELDLAHAAGHEAHATPRSQHRPAEGG